VKEEEGYVLPPPLVSAALAVEKEPPLAPLLEPAAVATLPQEDLARPLELAAIRRCRH
jgi:hypothetical protein